MCSKKDCFKKNVNQMMVDVHEIAISKGWWEKERSDGECIALMHSELSEALEWLRNGNGQSNHIDALGIEEEMADVVIRVMDFCCRNGYDLFGAIEKKVTFNANREYKHGGKLF